MKKKLNLKKETVALLDGMNEVRGGGGTVAVSVNSNCNLCPTVAATQCKTGCLECPTRLDTCGNPTTTGCITDRTCVQIPETEWRTCRTVLPTLLCE